MKVLELPDHIFKDKKIPDSDILFYHYSSDKDSLREKSILKKNAFSLVINGRKTMHFAEQTVQIKGNEIHLLSAGNCTASVIIENNKPFESILVFFSPDVLLDFYARHRITIIDQQKKNGGTKPYLEFEKDDFILNFIESVLLMLRSGKQLSESMKRLKLEELFLYLTETYPGKLASFQHAKKNAGIEFKIRQVTEANTDNNLTIDELAFLCNVSSSTFKRYFKKIYNCSPIEWQHTQRMKTAGQMLAHEKPGEIWHKLGFETHTGFTKSFKKYYGVAPKDFALKLTLQE